MAVLGAIFFKRTLKQFLDCDDLESARGVALIEKLRQSSSESLEYLIETIPKTSGMHRAMLTEICLEHVSGTTEELFLKGLDSDATEIRRTTASILSQSAQINPNKLFKKLHVIKTDLFVNQPFKCSHQLCSRYTVHFRECPECPFICVIQ